MLDAPIPAPSPTRALDLLNGLEALVPAPDEDEDLTRHGTQAEKITTLQRLVHVGRRAMGALEFEPAIAESRSPAAVVPLDMAHLAEDARRALRDSRATYAFHDQALRPARK
jgi:hypothetical protein